MTKLFMMFAPSTPHPSQHHPTSTAVLYVDYSKINCKKNDVCTWEVPLCLCTNLCLRGGGGGGGGGGNWKKRRS